MQQTTAQCAMIYGSTGRYKTTQLCSAAQYIWKKYGRRTRLISAEPASSADIVMPFVEAGVIEVFWMTRSVAPRSALQKLLRGEWPVAVQVEGGWRARFQPTPSAEWEHIGAYALEGTASMAELVLNALVAEGRKISEEVVGLYTEDGEKLGNPARSHFGAAQQDVLKWIKEAPKSLYDASRGMVEYIFVLGHESKGTDETTRQAIYGPGFVGQAATGKVGKDIGTMIHMEEVTEIQKVGNQTVPRTEVRAYFRSHPDSDNPNILWQAKPRIPPFAGPIAALDRKFPGGYFVPTPLDAPQTMGMKEFLEFQDRLQEMASESLKKMNEAKTTTTTNNK